MRKIDIDKKRKKEIQLVNLMIQVYCQGKHSTKGKVLCEECQHLADYAAHRTNLCPFMETKTFCSKCKVHCYQLEMKSKIKEVMKYSGPRLITKRPIQVMKHMLDK